MLYEVITTSALIASILARSSAPLRASSSSAALRLAASASAWALASASSSAFLAAAWAAAESSEDDAAPEAGGAGCLVALWATVLAVRSSDVPIV